MVLWAHDRIDIREKIKHDNIICSGCPATSLSLIFRAINTLQLLFVAENIVIKWNRRPALNVCVYAMCVCCVCVWLWAKLTIQFECQRRRMGMTDFFIPSQYKSISCMPIMSAFHGAIWSAMFVLGRSAMCVCVASRGFWLLLMNNKKCFNGIYFVH